MTTDRCPACGAAVTASAAWCTLCYADLRRAPEPELVAAAAPPATPAPVVPATPAALPPDPILDAPVVAAAPVARGADAFWPCLGCGSRVPISDDICSSCGASFLPTEAKPDVSLPGVGSMASLDRAQRVMVVMGVAFAAMLVLLGVAFALGSIL